MGKNKYISTKHLTQVLKGKKIKFLYLIHNNLTLQIVKIRRYNKQFIVTYFIIECLEMEIGKFYYGIDHEIKRLHQDSKPVLNEFLNTYFSIYPSKWVLKTVFNGTLYQISNNLR